MIGDPRRTSRISLRLHLCGGCRILPAMAMDRPDLESELLALPASERARLAHRLLVSLDDGADEDPLEVDRAWEMEIRRRVAELEAGTADLVDAEVFLAALRDRPRR